MESQYWVNELGQCHRLDGPAVIWSDGLQEWWVNGQYHRLDGPAVIGTDGYQLWYVNGVHISKEDIAKWMENNSINLKWDEWSDAEVVLFALRFV